jgi:hypothetical protein
MENIAEIWAFVSGKMLRAGAKKSWREKFGLCDDLVLFNPGPMT